MRDWQALTERLLRLPDAHPSSPASGDRVGGRGPDEWSDGEPGADGEPESEAEPGWGEAEPAPDLEPDPAELAGAEDALAAGDQDPSGEGHRAAGPAGWLAGLAGGTGGGRGRRAGYRPWFADGGPSQPWFAVGPDGAENGPERPTGPDG
jgi:hypothetical protein